MIDEVFIKRKITFIQNELVGLEPFSNLTFDEIAADYIKQAAVERILERIINRAIDINQHLIAELATEKTQPPFGYRDTFLRLADLGIYPKEFADEVSKSVGTRNKLIHEYDNINPKKIYSSIGDCLRDYQKYCDYVLNYMAGK